MSKIVSVDNLNKTFAKSGECISLFDNLTFDIEDGEFLAIMGPSGSGKSSLLNIIAGLDFATGGAVNVLGEDLTRMKDAELTKWRARNIGIVFQASHLLPGFTAMQNVEVPLLLTSLDSTQRKKRSRLALEIVGLKDRGNHQQHELSGGQRQRVAIARAIVSDPKLLVCDEPTGSLDRSSADAIAKLLKDLNEHKGKTVILVTHDSRIAGYADRVIYIDKGKVVEGQQFE